VASIGITQVISKQDKEPVVATADTQAIFVALEDIAYGDPITSQILRLEQWPKGKVPEGALTKIEDVEGRRTRSKLYAGEPILEKKLFDKGASALGHSTRIPKGYRVISVHVDKVSGSASMILPGDRVDVMLYLTRNPASGTYEATARTVLQDIKVFAVNDLVGMESDQNDKSINAQTISLLVTPEQAQTVMLATELGRIRLVMRSPDDPDQPETGELSLAKMFGLSDGADREQEEQAMEQSDSGGGPGQGFRSFLNGLRSKVASSANQPIVPELVQLQPNRHEMRIVSGAEVTRVLLESEGEPAAGGVEQWRIVTGGSDFSNTDDYSNVDDLSDADQYSENEGPEEEADTEETNQEEQ